MIPCQCKVGFFSLRDCRKTGLTQCTVCKRMICSEHCAEAAQQCRDCWARQAQESTDSPHLPTRSDERGQYDDDWAYSYRQRYYDSGYSPIYWGTSHRSHYDSHDARSFVADSGELDDGSDDPATGFGDS